MSLMRRCCKCPCQGNNCYEGYPRGCTNPCCWCTDIVGLDDCDEEYFEKLAACPSSIPLGDVCDDVSFSVSFSVPNSTPTVSYEGPDGSLYPLDAYDTRYVFTNYGLGLPPGVGDPQCHVCSGEPCDNCGSKLCHNCDNIGNFQYLQHYNWDAYTMGEVALERAWFSEGVTATIIATHQGNCKWAGETELYDAGTRYYLTCSSYSMACSDTKVESDFLCVCDPCDCFPGGTNFAACEESAQCNEWAPVCGAGGGYWETPGSCEDGDMPITWACCSGPPDGDDSPYLCDGQVEVDPQVYARYYCTYQVTPVRVHYKVKLEINNGSMRFTFIPEFDFADAFGSPVPPAGGTWAFGVPGGLLKPPNVGKCVSNACNCEVSCEEGAWDPTDCITWKSTYYTAYNECGCYDWAMQRNCSCCDDPEVPYANCSDPCGGTRFVEEKWAHKVGDANTLPDVTWTCCGTSHTQNLGVAEYYYNGVAPRLFSVSSGAGQERPCNQLCPDPNSFNTNFDGLNGWDGFIINSVNYA